MTGTIIKTKKPAKCITWQNLQEMKLQAEPITMLTAYDATQAKLVDDADVDVVLVGDSLGMVVQGYVNTLPVTLEHILYHTQAVSRGLSRALLIADLPFATYAHPQDAFVHAAQLVQHGGAAGVKLEGSATHVLESIAYVSAREIPVCGHLGLTPQAIHRLGGFHVQAQDAQAAEKLKRDALAVQQAGASLLVLECVPAMLAAEITRMLRIPTIGIGAGVQCDGQVLVFYDLLGMTHGRMPRFVRNFMPGQKSIRDALVSYVHAVKQRTFPTKDEAY